MQRSMPWAECSRTFGTKWRFLLASLVLSGCLAEPVILRPIHPPLEPPDRDAEFRALAGTWTYVVGQDGRKYVIMPLTDFQAVQRDRNEHKWASEGHCRAAWPERWSEEEER